MRNHIPEITKSIKEKELALFCGAGISKNSGLPLANELKQYILGKLPIAKRDVDEIMNSSLPFEAFMETISENTDISKILEVFQSGEPNTNHILVARLAKNGYLKTVLTTNFDLLIEKALKKEGLKRNKDFEVYYDEEQFSGIDFEDIDDKIIRIFKVHGSVEDKESIRTIMFAVASKTLSDKRMSVIRYLFSDGSHKKVLILGYSCSDEFDITPQIESVTENRKEIIFIEHSQREEIEDIKTKSFKNPFKRFSGIRIRYDTDEFIEKLWNSPKEITEEKYKLSKSEVVWGKYVDDWAKGLEKNKGYLKYSTAGLIFYGVLNFSRAIENYEKSLEIAKEIGDKGKESACYGNLGIAYRNLGDVKRAIKYYEKSLEIDKRTGNKLGASKSYTNLGVAHSSLGDFKRAIENYEKSLEIAKETGDKVGASKCYGGLSVAYRELRDFRRAIEYNERSLKLARETGGKAVESQCYLNLGIIYHDLGNFKKAVGYHNESLEIDKEIGDKIVESRCYIGLGLTYHNLRNFKRAIEYYLNAEKVFKEIGQINYLRGLYNNLSVAYKKIGDNENTEKYKMMAEFR